MSSLPLPPGTHRPRHSQRPLGPILSALAIVLAALFLAAGLWLYLARRRHPASADGVMRRALVLAALACAALLPAQAMATPTKAVIVHLQPRSLPPLPTARATRPGRSSARDGGRRRRVLAQLAALRREGHVRHVRSLWIANAIALTADATRSGHLRARADVSSIEADSDCRSSPPTPSPASPASP